jgi:hypothetical protein
MEPSCVTERDKVTSSLAGTQLRSLSMLQYTGTEILRNSNLTQKPDVTWRQQIENGAPSLKKNVNGLENIKNMVTGSLGAQNQELLC